MVEWHNPGLDPQDIAEIIKEGREENDKKFDSYSEYADYIYQDNERILKKHLTLDWAIEELRKDREERDEYLLSIIEQSFIDHKNVLDKLGSDYDEDGIPYWEKWDKDEK